MSVESGVKLTKFERLILINQYKILANQAKIMKDMSLREAGEDAYVTLLRNGFPFEINSLFCPINEYMDKDKCECICNILNLYDTLAYNYNTLNSEELAQIEKPIFYGFDRFDECDAYQYALYLKNNEYYPNIYWGKDAPNSRIPMLNKYIEELESVDNWVKDNPDSPLIYKYIKKPESFNNNNT